MSADHVVALGLEYPRELAEAECAMIRQRREKAGIDGAGTTPSEIGSNKDTRVGVALSGGGIRSATFCLGVCQALADADLIRRIDFLSTVSGGGYCGGFLGRLYEREWISFKPEECRVTNRRDAEPLEPTRPEDQGLKRVTQIHERVRWVLTKTKSSAIRWLRDSARHLAPNGSGDQWINLAVLLRNWVALMVVLTPFFFMAFCLLDALRGTLWFYLPGWRHVEVALMAATRDHLWWSPVGILPLAAFALFVVPLGWAYWFTQEGDLTAPLAAGQKQSAVLVWFTRNWAWVSAAFVIGVAVWAARILSESYPATGGVLWWLGIAGVLALLWWRIAVSMSRQKIGASPRAVHYRTRNRLSSWLATWLSATAALLFLAWIDSLGQTVYALLSLDRDVSVLFPAISAVTGGAILIAAGQKLKIWTDALPKRPGVQVPVKLLGTLVAVVIVILLLTGIAVAAHALAWGARSPVYRTSPDRTGPITYVGTNLWQQWAPTSEVKLSKDNFVQVVEAEMVEPKNPGWRINRRFAATGFFAVLLLSLLFAHVPGFLNLSTLQSLYASRLIRAYLGASNPNRWSGVGQSLSQVVACDDRGWTEYKPYVSGGPLHLVNVTLNETVSGESQIEYRDRKGMNFAVGPAGLSVGRKHHALWEAHHQCLGIPGGGALQSQVLVRPIAWRPGIFHALSAAPEAHRCEDLSLGNWLAISGAAFSTGLGARTTLGNSILAGLFNVRLGYWWDSGIDPRHRLGERRRGRTKREGQNVIDPGYKGKFGGLMGKWFMVQSHLLDEFTARFHGPAYRRRWYLSDGGHFENTGAYELVRRRLPFIIICDCGCDRNYDFDDVSQLVRRLRVDFCVETRFLGSDECARLGLPPEVQRHIGTPAEVRASAKAAACRNRATVSEDCKSPEAPSGETKSALLAELQWPASDGMPATVTRMLIIKPCLTGKETQDVLNYHRSEPDFPQQSTADQFFDEAQWESYRQLGQSLATLLFPKTLGPQAGNWWAPLQRG